MRLALPKPSWSWASLPALITVWGLAASQVPDYVLPQPWAVVAEALRWLGNGSLGQHVGASVLRELAGYGAAAIVALILGVAGAVSVSFRKFAGPLIGLFMAVPPIAWAPLCMIFFGLGNVAIVVVIFIASVFPMTIAMQEGFLAIRSGHVRAARTLGARRWQLLRHVYLPASLPFLTASLRIGFGQAWRALVAAEMLGASRGIGWMVAMGGQIGNTTQVLLGIAIIGFTAWLAESLVFRRMERHYRTWHLNEGTYS